MLKKEFLVSSGSELNLRLDIFLTDRIHDLSRSQIKRLIDGGQVKVNGNNQRSSYKLKAEDKVEIEYEIEEPEKIQPEDIPVKTLYSDSHLAVILKPSGMVVHPGTGNQRRTLVNALLHHFPDIKGVGPEDRPGIVHRLDKETSGLMVVARTEVAYIRLQQQFKNKEVGKVYHGIVWGKMPEKKGKIKWPIGRHIKHGERISVKTKKPKEAETHYSVLKEFGECSFLEIKPITGRTHQIRVHLAASGHPLVGDSRYGRRKTKVKYPSLFLFASRLAFTHPQTGDRLEFSSSLPEEMRDFLIKKVTFPKVPP